MTGARSHPHRAAFLAEVERRYGDLVAQDLTDDDAWFDQFCDATVTTDDDARDAALEFGKEYDLDDLTQPF